ncbi:hypothetical protein FNV43_RR00444 [Rhamnella rubrinervis]|uniref:Uncharacterized protein n=1 Tax=Rhamnella rubrinervis TaxID=2594499 RepID=A0A8K0HN20_9ROSA|nr:hypothetical protein FNV43_RR00444 [Rhamnella rubrinervis]
MVVLTARDEMKGLEAVQKLKECGGFSDNVVFHQLDVADPSSIASLADFVKTQFGKLDILVNNAGVSGVIVDDSEGPLDNQPANWKIIQTYDLAEECVKINYYGAKRTTEALIPFLQLSDSPTIVNVSSGAGALQYISNEWTKEVLSNVKSLTEEKVDDVLNEFLKEYKKDSSEVKYVAYKMSKAAMNSYTRILAKKYPKFRINAVSPGYVKTDINCHTGHMTIEEGATSVVRLALLPDDGPSGLFFARQEVSSF